MSSCLQRKWPNRAHRRLFAGGGFGKKALRFAAQFVRFTWTRRTESHLQEVSRERTDSGRIGPVGLYVLARTPGRVFSRMELLDRVQGTTYEGYERTIDVHIKNLRKKLEADPRHPRYILTVYGAGYRFAEDVDG